MIPAFRVSEPHLAARALLCLATSAIACQMVGCSGTGHHRPSLTHDLEHATTPITATCAFPLEQGVEALIEVESGQDDWGESERIVYRRTSTDEHGAHLAVAEADRRVEFLRLNDDGSISMSAVIDRHENALTLFTPPLVIMPSVLQPGDEFSSESSMRVVALDDPTRQRERGVARRTIANVVDSHVEVGGKQHATARLDVHFTADLRFADAEERTSMYVSPVEGVMLIRSRERVTILGAFPRTTTRTLIREPQTRRP